MTDTAAEQPQGGPHVSGTEPPPADTAQQGTADRVQQDTDELISLLQRERADFANYRRRMAQERAEDADRVRAQEILALLPFLDDLHRAIVQVPDDLKDHPWVRGIMLSYRRLLDFLKQSGVEQIGREGEEFDPMRHEALFYEERPDATDREVTTVVKPGYRMGERVLRPAQVGVSGPMEASGRGDVATGDDRQQPEPSDRR